MRQEVTALNSSIISRLNRKYGYSLKTDYYNVIEIWHNWWQGFYEPFHRVKFDDGKQIRSRDMYTMKMAKKICEDWASLLINDKTIIKVTDEYSYEWLQGDNQHGGVLGANNFWEQANDLMERMMYSGTAAVVIRMNAAVNSKGGIVTDSENRIRLIYLSAEKIIPLSVDNGVITEAAFCSNVSIRGKSKLYLEIHKLENSEYIIENHIFGTDLTGRQIIREEKLPDNIPPVVHTGSDMPWFCICKPAVVNSIDGSNGLGCAVFANAVDNLKGVDIAYNNLNSDFKLGQKKVFINNSLLETDSNGRRTVPDDVDQQLFVTLGVNFNDDGAKLIAEHNPDLRVEDNTNGIQAQLDYLSFKVGFGTKHYQFNSGSIVTATQYTGDKQDLIQNAHKHFIKVEAFLQRLTRTLLHIGHEYIDQRVNPDCGIEIMFDQSPLIDENAERIRDREDVSAGLMMPWEYRMKWYGEDENTAKNALDNIESDDEILDFGDGEG